MKKIIKKTYQPKTHISIKDGRPITAWQHKLEMIEERDKFFVKLCEQRNMPIPIREYVFIKEKKYRLDFAWADKKVALEVQGGYETKERQGHSRKEKAETDFKKNAAANLMGWRIYYCMPDELYSLRVEMMMRMALGMIPINIAKICTTTNKK